MSALHYGRVGGSLYTPCGRSVLQCAGALTTEIEAVTCGLCNRSSLLKKKRTFASQDKRDDRRAAKILRGSK